MAEFESGPFSAVDPQLNIYALANGMDLVRGDEARRLEWYLDGRERGILLELTADGTIRVTAQAWSQFDSSAVTTVPQGPPHTPDALGGKLSVVLAQALEAANGL